MLDRPRAVGRMAMTLVAVVLLATCTGSSEPESREERIGRVLARQAAAAPAAQRAVLDDGEVTFAEYEDAVRDTIDCLRREGVAVDGPHPDPDNPELLTFGYGGADTPEGLAALEPIYNQCYGEHLSVIDEVYAFANRPTPEQDAETRRQVAQCLERDYAIEVTEEDPTDEDLARATATQPGALIECQTQVALDDE